MNYKINKRQADNLPLFGHYHLILKEGMSPSLANYHISPTLLLCNILSHFDYNHLIFILVEKFSSLTLELNCMKYLAIPEIGFIELS